MINPHLHIYQHLGIWTKTREMFKKKNKGEESRLSSMLDTACPNGLLCILGLTPRLRLKHHVARVLQLVGQYGPEQLGGCFG